MLALGVSLIVLAILAYIARAILHGLNAPGWLDQVLVGLVLLVALYLVAQALGAPFPNLR